MENVSVTFVTTTVVPSTKITFPVAPDRDPVRVTPTVTFCGVLTVKAVYVASDGLARPSNLSYPAMRVYPPLIEHSKFNARLTTPGIKDKFELLGLNLQPTVRCQVPNRNTSICSCEVEDQTL